MGYFLSDGLSHNLNRFSLWCHYCYLKSPYTISVIIQAFSGVPVAVRMREGVRFVADQTITPEAQDNQPQIVLPPDSREMDDPPPPYQAVPTGYQTLQVDMPPSYEEAEHGQWKTYV